ncbi:hypothetical protein JKP88DRAFT_81895 [Tribonema minus]|uniref:Uncharacterized protein n=1 Tax=Tribonema minus TaxID=303371 RepID=A0A835YMX0_9STRA|nr:hypothetical protein JKP88DRAFT_81895 [Tribonema minus]
MPAPWRKSVLYFPWLLRTSTPCAASGVRMQCADAAWRRRFRAASAAEQCHSSWGGGGEEARGGEAQWSNGCLCQTRVFVRLICKCQIAGCPGYRMRLCALMLMPTGWCNWCWCHICWACCVVLCLPSALCCFAICHGSLAGSVLKPGHLPVWLL